MPQRFRSFAFTGILALILPLVAACSNTQTGTTGPSVSSGDGFAGTIVFGAPLSITGGTSKEGKLTKDGYDLWLEAVNSKGGIKVGEKKYKAEIKYYDDESKAETAAKLTEKLITEDKVNFLLGPYGTASTFAASAIAEKYEMPMVEANGAAESIFSRDFKYTFGVLSPAKKYLEGVVQLAVTLTPKPATVAILSANDAFSVEVADGAKTAAELNGLQVVYYEKYPSEATDVSSLLTAVKGKNPDLVLNSGHLSESLVIMKQSKELGLSPKVFAFSVGPSTPDFTEALKADANYVWGGTQWTPAVKYKGDDYWSTAPEYAKAFMAKFNYEPDYHNAESTAACIAFQKAIEKAGSLDPKKVRDELAKLDFVSFFGQIKFDSRGINTFKPMAVEQIQNGKKVTVFPKDVAEGPAQYPTPPWTGR